MFVRSRYLLAAGLLCLPLPLPHQAAAQSWRDVRVCHAHISCQEDWTVPQWEESARAGSPAAMFRLGRLHWEAAANRTGRNEAVRWYRAAAELGYLEAMQTLGDIYRSASWLYSRDFRGDTVPVDYREAARWYREAARHGYSTSSVRYAELLLEGQGVTRDYEEARRLLLAGAEAGVSDAYSGLMRIYREGLGVPRNDSLYYHHRGRWMSDSRSGDDLIDFGIRAVRDSIHDRAHAGDVAHMLRLAQVHENGEFEWWADDVLAFQWYYEAARRGNTQAASSLGRFYETGRAIAPNRTEALRWYSQAAAAGDSSARAAVARLSGDEVRQPDTPSSRTELPEVASLRRRAESGDASAMNRLGFRYRGGDGVPQSNAEALRWYRQAANAGDAAAMTNLGTMYHHGRGVTQDHAEALRWFRRGAEGGNPVAMQWLGAVYRRGQGVAQDDAESVRWYRQGADRGDRVSMSELGFMYRNGRGVSQSNSEALRWYRAAADLGYATAMNNIGFMYENGHGVPADRSQALDWYRRGAAGGNESAQRAVARLEGEN